jgi:hypothetical protein
MNFLQGAEKKERRETRFSHPRRSLKQMILLSY